MADGAVAGAEAAVGGDQPQDAVVSAARVQAVGDVVVRILRFLEAGGKNLDYVAVRLAFIQGVRAVVHDLDAFEGRLDAVTQRIQLSACRRQPLCLQCGGKRFGAVDDIVAVDVDHGFLASGSRSSSSSTSHTSCGKGTAPGS